MIRTFRLRGRRLFPTIATLRAIPSWIVQGPILAYLWPRYVYHARIHPKRILGRILPSIMVATLSYVIANKILTEEPAKVLATVMALLVGGLVVSRVKVAVTLYMLLSASIVYPNMIPKPITFGGAGLHFGEILLILILVMVFVSAYAEKRHMGTPMTPALAFLFFAILLSIWVSYRQYQENPRGFYDFKTTYNAARYLFPYAFFYAILYGVKDKRDLRVFLNIALALAAFVSLMMVLQFMVGNRASLFFGTPEGLDYFGSLSKEDLDVTRIQPPGVSLNCAMALLAVYFAASHTGRRKYIYGALAALYAAAVVFSFARSTWTTISLSLFLMFIFSSRQLKGKLLLVLATGVLAAMLFATALTAVSPGRGAHLREACLKRAESLFTHETYDTTSVTVRQEENKLAMRIIRQHPVFGVGMGAPIQQRLVRVGPGFVPFDINWIHNSHLDIWVHLGLSGMLAFAWLSFMFLYRALRLWRRADEMWIRCMALAFAMNYVGWLIRSSVVMMMIHQVPEIVMVTFMWGMVEAASILAIPKPDLSRQREIADAGMVPIAAPVLGARS